MSASGSEQEFEGQLLEDRYRVQRSLGAGGMATVYLATDEKLEREVAVKIPRPKLLAEAGFAERFALEMKSLIRLDHPRIVKVHDTGSHGGLPFVVMQYLAGGSLSSWLGRSGTKNTLEHVAVWLPAIAEALDFLHGEDLVHRDVKPGNILFDGAENAFLADFGIAKVMGDYDTGLTLTGTTPGTPFYMGPEIATGHKVSAAYDQYALATMVYEMLAGERPFQAETPMRLLYRKASEHPTRIEEVVRSLPAGTAAAVMRGLRREPDERFATCREFAAAVLGSTTGSVPSLDRTVAAPAPANEGADDATTQSEPSDVSATVAANESSPGTPTELPTEPVPESGDPTKTQVPAAEGPAQSSSMGSRVLWGALGVVAVVLVAVFVVPRMRGNETVQMWVEDSFRPRAGVVSASRFEFTGEAAVPLLAVTVGGQEAAVEGQRFRIWIDLEDGGGTTRTIEATSGAGYRLDPVAIAWQLKTPQLVTADGAKGGAGESKKTAVEKPKPKPKDPERKTDTPKTDTPKADPPKTDPPKTDPPKTDPPKTDPSKTDLPKTDTPKTDTPKADAPKADAPRSAGETTKPEATKGDTSRPESEKVWALGLDQRVIGPAGQLTGSSALPLESLTVDGKAAIVLDNGRKFQVVLGDVRTEQRRELKIVVKSRSGFEHRLTRFVDVDCDGPELTKFSPVNQSFGFGEKVNVTGVADEILSRVLINDGEVPLAADRLGFRHSVTIERTLHPLKIELYDQFENKRTHARHLSGRPPAIQITDVASVDLQEGVRFTVKTDREIAKARVDNEDVAVKKGAREFEVDKKLRDGPNRVEFRVTDAHGGERSATKEVFCLRSPMRAEVHQMSPRNLSFTRWRRALPGSEVKLWSDRWKDRPWVLLLRDDNLRKGKGRLVFDRFTAYVKKHEVAGFGIQGRHLPKGWSERNAFPDVRSIVLAGPALAKGELRLLVTKTPNLAHLELKGVKLPGLEGLAGAKNLRTLRVKQVANLSRSAVKVLVGLPKLEKLYFAETGVRQADLDALFKARKLAICKATSPR